MTTHRGTSNTNDRGSSYSRRRRREWLIEAWRADVDTYDAHASLRTRRAETEGREVTLDEVPALWLACTLGEGEPACRCYRCGALLTVDTVTSDRIDLGCDGGRYKRDNIRPACGPCNSSTGGTIGNARKKAAADV